MPSRQQTEDQKRAAQAWNCVARVKETGFSKEYKSLAQKLPSYILTNGLGQTLAFLKAKGKGDRASAHEALYVHLSEWVTAQITGDANDRLLAWVMQRDSASYRRTTVEALAFIAWLKRFAEAELS